MAGGERVRAEARRILGVIAEAKVILYVYHEYFISIIINNINIAAKTIDSFSVIILTEFEYVIVLTIMIKIGETAKNKPVKNQANASILHNFGRPNVIIVLNVKKVNTNKIAIDKRQIIFNFLRILDAKQILKLLPRPDVYSLRILRTTGNYGERRPTGRRPTPPAVD